ncbi:hypothetical protein [Thermococcus sp.]|uniref:hypothetical protein n=1 Tax=Thermococcus sp. TaxID=35749 RepID=UPI0026374B86|nr:hypothetical protein [Thermococcus sp.]
MKSKVWNGLIAGTTGFFLILFLCSREYFIRHHLIPVSFAVLGVLGCLRAYESYKSGNSSRLQLYGTLVLAVTFILIGIWMGSVANRVLLHTGGGT